MNSRTTCASRFRATIAVFLIFLVSFLVTTRAAEVCALDIAGHEIEVTLDSTYVSKYIWKGYDLLDDNGAWQPSIGLYYEGFCAGVWGSWADEAGFTAQDELDYYFGYERTLFEDRKYALDAFVAYTYFDYPKSDSVSGEDWVADGQEISFGFSMPNLIPIGPSSLVPSYEACFEWAGIQSGGDVDRGWIHTFGLAYDIPIPALIPGQEEQYLSLGGDISYNDGVYGSEPGWSHSTVSVSTVFEWQGFSFTPAVYHQWSFEDTVNDEDEFYTSFSLSYSF